MMMDSAKQIPVLYQVDALLLGGTTLAVDRALTLAEQGKRVLVAAPQAFLGTEAGCLLAYPEGETPDNYKKRLEDRCTAAGVRLLYMAWYLDTLPQKDGNLLVRLGGKFGVAGVLARTMEDYRVDFDDTTFRAYLAGKADPDRVQILEVQVPPAPAGAHRLLAARRAVLAAYGDSGLPGEYSLGRFSARGGKAIPLTPANGTVSHTVTAHVDGFRRKLYPVLAEDAPFTGEEQSYDIVVAGAGTAGCMAALAAARTGLRVAVAEPNYAPGGTGTVGGVSAYWFGNRYRDVKALDSRVAALSGGEAPGLWGRVDNWNPDIKATVLLEQLLEAGVDLYLGHAVFGVWQEEGKPAGLAAVGSNGIRFLRGKYLLDATGDGDVAVFAGADSDYGNSRDRISYWASLAQYPTAHTYRNNFSAMMLTCDPLDHTNFVLRARRFGGALFDHGTCAAPRESRHIRGRTTLTLKDLMTHTHHPDTLYTCYSNYDPKGKITGDILYCGLLPQQNRIEIPLGALLPVDRAGNPVAKLLVLGKAISASHDIFPSIRMQPDLIHQGFCAGTLVGFCLKTGRDLWDLTGEEIRAILAPVTDDPLEAPAEGTMSLAECVRNLDRGTRTHWVDMDFTDCETQFQVLPALMYAPADQVLPLIRQELVRREGPDRIPLVRLALWHGDDTYLQEHLDGIAARLAGDSLPLREGATTCAQLLPDHGVMPEVVYDMNLLARSGKEGREAPFIRVFDLLNRRPRDYQDVKKGIFPYIESFAFVAERRPSPKLLELTERLSALPELASAESLPDGDLMKQRFLLLRFLLHRALALNGRASGYGALVQCLGSPVRTLAASAWQCLTELTGRDFGYEAGPWLDWVKENPIPVSLVSRQYN